jgi:quercetin dioxygenase-like cupin family protein
MGTNNVFADIAKVTGAEVCPSVPEQGLTRRVGAHNEKLFLVEHRMENGWVGAAHSHPHEQVVYVVSGRLRVAGGGRTFDVGPGDSFVVRGGVEHQASALEPSVVIDVFTPARLDYL